MKDGADKAPRHATYIGDAVYAQYDVYGRVLLTTDSHEEKHAQNSIVLEPEVLHNLMQWLERTRK